VLWWDTSHRTSPRRTTPACAISSEEGSIRAGGLIDLARAKAIVAMTGNAKLQQSRGEVLLETLDSQVVLNSEKFVDETLSAVVEGCVVTLE
jgi:hypothetical protein